MNPVIEKEPVMSTPAPSLTPEQLEAFGQELDAIRARVVADLGERDADYINKVIRTQRGLEVAGRCCSASCRRPGSAAPPPCRCRRSSTTWRSGTT
jgi:hypothetical protein